MQKVKTCPVCGGQFVTNRSTTVYCSKVCYGADSSRKKMRRTNIDVGYKELVAPPRDEFDLDFLEAIRTDRGWERSFTKADYITGEVRRVKNEQKHN